MRELKSVDDSFEQRWRTLEQRSIESNVFLAPQFVLPAVRHLALPSASVSHTTASQTQPWLLTIEVGAPNAALHHTAGEDNWQLIGLGLFAEAAGNTLMPLSLLKCWRSEHSYFDGLLIDRDYVTTGCDAFFAWLKSQCHRWHGVSFEERSLDGPLATAMTSAAEAAGITWHEDHAVERAAIVTAELPEDCYSVYSRSRRQNYRRLRRRLADHGTVDLQCRLLKAAEVESELHTFLELEAAGWKGDEGSALVCSDGDIAFLHEMIHEFAADDRVVLCRLTVNGQAIAASLNLQAGDTLSAFKLGWHSDWRSFSPGIQCVIGLLEAARSLPRSPMLIDSCTSPGGYLDPVWPARRRLATGVFASTMTGRLAADTLGRAKSLKRLVQSALT